MGLNCGASVSILQEFGLAILYSSLLGHSFPAHCQGVQVNKGTWRCQKDPEDGHEIGITDKDLWPLVLSTSLSHRL